jgi:hypothetical protein
MKEKIKQVSEYIIQGLGSLLVVLLLLAIVAGLIVFLQGIVDSLN